MKLLLDQNLSPALASRLSDFFPGSAHLRTHHMQRAPDAVVWHFAIEGGYTIVTKVGDFSDRSTLYGFPPKVVWFKRGNCSTADVTAILQKRSADIRRFGDDPNIGLLVIE